MSKLSEPQTCGDPPLGGAEPNPLKLTVWKRSTQCRRVRADAEDRSTPRYARALAKGKPRGRVWFRGRWKWLPGAYDSRDSRVAYDEIVCEWKRDRETPRSIGLTVGEFALQYLEYAEQRYVKVGKPTSKIATSARRSGGSSDCSDHLPSETCTRGMWGRSNGKWRTRETTTDGQSINTLADSVEP